MDTDVWNKILLNDGTILEDNCKKLDNFRRPRGNDAL